MYAIINIRTKKWLCGTNYGTNGYYLVHPRQFTSSDKMLTYSTPGEADHDMIMRKCGKDYRIVEIQPIIKNVLG